MGIKQLAKVIGPYVKKGCWKDMESKIIAIDTSIFLYKFQVFSKVPYFGFIHQILLFKKYGVRPFYIFDGKPPKEKATVINERKEKRAEATKERDELVEKINKNETELNEETKKKLITLNNQCIKITNNEITTLKMVFDTLGIAYYTAPGEAEWFCSKLCENGIVDACLSEDTDLLPNGCKLWIKDYKADSPDYDYYVLDDILKGLNMTYFEFQDMCILMGCDYLKPLTKIGKKGGVGPILAAKLIKEHKTIEEVIKTHDKTINFEQWDYVKARELFNMPISKEILGKMYSKMDSQIPKIEKALEVFDLICEKFETENKSLRKKLKDFLFIVNNNNIIH